jgi:hypothetical protein
MSVSKLKEVLDAIDCPIMVEIVECMWVRRPWEVKWNLDDSKEDLENGDDNTYSCGTRGCSSEYDGYLVVNGDTCCGQTITYFFNLSKEVKF